MAFRTESLSAARPECVPIVQALIRRLPQKVGLQGCRLKAAQLNNGRCLQITPLPAPAWHWGHAALSTTKFIKRMPNVAPAACCQEDQAHAE